jgi:hypothetical protein
MSHPSNIVTSATDNNSHGSLSSAILYANAHSGTKITFAAKLAHHTIKLGADQHRVFFADSGNIDGVPLVRCADHPLSFNALIVASTILASVSAQKRTRLTYTRRPAAAECVALWELPSVV